jgi:crotonobetainyl-CoA:carnitine CoA-transferase CaiB-like acyl-CoA transferase
MGDMVGALADLHILDLTDERSIYGAKLLADLGADVVRPEPPGGDPLRQRGPHFEQAGAGATSLWHAFFASNRRFFTVDPETDEAAAQLQRLVERADIVLTCDRGFGMDLLDLQAEQQKHPELVIINTSSFGQQGPWRDFLAPDIVAGALGGAAATTGDVDTPPLKGFGELNFMISGAYVAIAALSALFSARATGAGQRADVAVHECLVSCLEQVLMFYWYSERLNRDSNVLPRQGATHWSNAYTVMSGQNGSIMITPTPSFDNQLAWLIEEGVHEDLIEPKYMAPENLGLRIQRTMEILRKWVATKDVESLFHEAQERHSPYGWVLPIERVADNPQLDARRWYTPYKIGEAETQAPGAPYHFSATPWSMADYHGPGADTATVLAEIGWGDK